METSTEAPTRRRGRMRTPGAVQAASAPADTETDIDKLADAAGELADDPTAAATAAAAVVQRAGKGEVMAVTKAELQAMVAAAVADAVSAKRASQAAPTQAELPDQRDIDLKTLTRPTLTKQGYVVPPLYGTPVAETAAQRG